MFFRYFCNVEADALLYRNSLIALRRRTTIIYGTMSLRDLFYLQKSDRIVMLVLLTIATIALLFIVLIGNSNNTSTIAQEKNRAHAENGQAAGDELPLQPSEVADFNSGERFPFDPNTADSTQLRRLGLSQKIIRNIYKYRAKGGIFSKPEDFARLYGLTVGQYRSLAPYIRISSDYLPASTLFESSPRGSYERNYDSPTPFDKEEAHATTHDTTLYPRKLRPDEHIPLNTTDTTLLKRVPGIGSYYARAIVSYGQRLGGYVSVVQLMDIKNFPETALDYFTLDNPAIRKINLNKLSLEQLRKHPYVSFYMARSITDYRRLHGPLKSLNDLRLLPDFTPEVIERLKPYVEF